MAFFVSDSSPPPPLSKPLHHAQENHRRWTSRRSQRQSVSLERGIFQRATNTLGCLLPWRKANNLQRHGCRCFSNSCWAGCSQLLLHTPVGSHCLKLFDQLMHYRSNSVRFDKIMQKMCTILPHCIEFLSKMIYSHWHWCFNFQPILILNILSQPPALHPDA